MATALAAVATARTRRRWTRRRRRGRRGWRWRRRWRRCSKHGYQGVEPKQQRHKCQTCTRMWKRQQTLTLLKLAETTSAHSKASNLQSLSRAGEVCMCADDLLTIRWCTLTHQSHPPEQHHSSVNSWAFDDLSETTEFFCEFLLFLDEDQDSRLDFFVSPETSSIKHW